MNRKSFGFFVFIVVLFLHSRLLFFPNVPSTVYWDEASIGYNAYSVLMTGRDETGEAWPLHFRAFGEFKLPVYIYSTVPFIKFLGLNSTSVRLPAIIYSLLSVYLVYELTKQISNRKSIAYLAAFFFAISKWYFIFSRTGYEATAGLFFLLASLYALLKTEKGTSHFVAATILLVLSMYSYNSFRLIGLLTFVPVLGLVAFKKSKSWYAPFHLGLAFAIFILSLIPIYKVYAYDSGLSRLSQVGTELSFGTVVSNYFKHLSPRFLFFSGDSNLRSNLGFGELYKLDSVFLLLGVIYLLRKKDLLLAVPLLGLALAFLPAAITNESPHALRSIMAVPFFAMISAYGVYELVRKNTRNIRFVFYALIMFFYLLSFENYLIEFFTTYPTKSAEHWQYQYGVVFSDYSQEFGKFKRIVVTPEGAQPYIFALFYQSYDPVKFRDEVVFNPQANWGFSKVEKFNKFEFVESDTYEHGTLVFSKKGKVMDLEPVASVKYPDGSFALNVFEI